MENKKIPKNHTSQRLSAFGLLFVLSLTLIFFTSPVKAEPAGATVSNNVTATSAAATPDNRSDAGGTITTMLLSTVQQDANWKAYVGNVSGSLTLDDANGNTIYSWALSAAEVTGELYISKSINVGWSTLGCSSDGLINSEDTTIGFSAISADSINRTFNETTHDAIFVAGRTINQDTCRTTATFVNDSQQSIASANFPEIILASGTDLVYMTPLNQGSDSFVNESLVDFQAIVPDDVTTAITRYYFYVEIGS
ncbi:MAG: hypothetical protein WC758_04640 [Candidatus Woesearchaeota archaeon]|jgi:hypothetical protein